jgi:Fe-S cluster assembly iron-binding protein IscA
MLRQLTWSIACICLGATPGLLIYATLKQWFALVVAGLGGVVGFGLSLTDTSLSRVARGTTAAILAKNVPLLGSKAWDALLGKSQGQKDEQAACDHFRKLPEYDLVTVTDVAAEQLRGPAGSTESPLRLVAEINEQLPHFLHYNMYFDTQCDPRRDVLCLSNGINFVIDDLTARRIKGTVLDWEEQGDQQGFAFKNPNWPRENLDKEPWEDETS